MKTLAGSHDGRGLAIGIVCARWNEIIGRTELEACAARLRELGVDAQAVTVVNVPGALEIPLALQRLAATDQFDALIAFGAVIRGETYHFEIVSNESASGITQVQLDTGVPIANGILTTNTDDQAAARAGQKGRDCAEAAVEMARLVAAIAASAK